ncbi:MAG: hypothetical protein V1716_05315 [Candidatus Uhrbacteria bacterium]
MFSKQKIGGVFLLLVFFSGFFSTASALAASEEEIMASYNPAIRAVITSMQASLTAPKPGPVQGALIAVKEAVQMGWAFYVAPVLKQMAVTAMFDLVSYASDTLAKNTAVWIANGAPGQEPLFQSLTGYESWKTLGLDLAADGLGSLSQVINDYYDINFNLCAPEEPLFRLGLQIGIQGMYQPRKPKCEWQAVAENWDGFIQNTLESTEDPTGQALNMLAKSFQPGQTSLAYMTILNNKIIFKVDEKKNADFMESLFSLGYKPVEDIVVNGKVLTPSDVVREQVRLSQGEAVVGKSDKYFATMLSNKDIWSSIAYQSIKIFTTTLVGTFIQNIQTGFFKTDDVLIDPFSELSESSSTVSDAEDFYADLVSTIPVTLSDYNVLSEFAVCPSSPSTRQLNNCVADASLVQGIGRTFGAEVITVADALEAGYLHGDWPLYSPDDRIHNQDSLCYTYGYCYGNLVKLRKARIIPVGWEMAAALSDTSDPITLQEVVDNFNNCDSDGKASPSTPWCHMIDPNWLLKYPQQNCNASMVGEITISSMISARSATCVDSPSCLAEDDDGTCEAYGDCVREKNTWDFNGDSCPEESLSCLNFTNSDSSETGTWLFNSLDQGVCSAANAGCLWYRTNKYLDNGGTADDVSDDAFEWLPGDEIYETSTRDDSKQYYDGTSYSTRASFDYDTDADGVDDDGLYNVYAFEDRAYFNSEVEACTESEAGCSEVYAIGDDELSLNIIRNPSFEDDEDDDGLADLWSASTVSPPVYNESDSLSHQGNSNYLLSTGSVLSQEDIPLQQNHSYVLSFYAKGVASGNVVTAWLTLSASDNSTVSLTGYSSNCTTSVGNNVTKLATTTSVAVFTSYECTFNTPILTNDRLWIVADLSFRAANGTYVDAVQIEARETASGFHTAYNESAPTTAYLQIPPDWLGCTGEATDPADCANYTQVCSATEVGCSLYTPSDGDPAVPAVISDSDQCPSECVGYATYKQESTDYDTEEFPLYFIADSAQICSSSDVGCDEFTNLETEGIEAYSHLRACLTPEMADVNDVDRSAVYFTWEGSDMTGYQLVSYQLLSSNLSNTSVVQYTQDTDGDGTWDFEDTDYDGDGVLDQDEGHGRSGMQEEDSTPENAPCTIWDVRSENTLVCDDNTAILKDIHSCNENSDVLTNPDCREFYDSLGDIHYRLYSETISISDVCTAYRKTDANATDCNDSGGYWTGSGECRYFIEPDESTICSTSSAGCREYTGGGSRNSSTVLTDYFEDGTYDSYVKVGTTNSTLTISNESVAVDGHSLRVSATAAGDGFKTLQDYYNTDRLSVCLTAGGCNSLGTLCTVENGAESCGTLVDELVAGKTYVLKFWAKGSGNIGVALTEQGGTTGGIIRDLAYPDRTSPPAAISGLTAVALSGSWQLYELGPLDTSLLTNFDDNAILGFYSLSAGAQTFYIDNIQLEQTEENLTLIKNSWVTPSTCDETPEGVVSEQYYLGCEEYADQNNSTYNIYQFSSICSEGAVGCDDFYVTQNSDATYAQIFNATCYNPVNTDGDSFFAYTFLAGLNSGLVVEDAVASATSCTLDGTVTGQELCTIAAGHNQCQFDYDGTLPTPMARHLALGPETVFVPADEVAYLINDGEFSCSAANMGCTEVGIPTFSDDNSLVTSFESAYLLNQPDSYDDILCNDNELFCGEWVTTKAENYYFKDPGNKSCEYKSGVSLNSVSYDGWFRTGTTEFCYGEGVCSVSVSVDGNGDEVFEDCFTDADCAGLGAGTCTITNGSYLKNGTLSSLWFSGDDDYDGWAGTCDSVYDYCTEFIDPLDTKENENLEGASYFYLDNDAIDEENNVSTDRCNGQASLQEGCVLFNDVMNQELTYSSSPSYLVSEHADIFFGENPRSFQNPVSCSDPDNGEFTTTTGDSINVCYNRCAYFVSAGSGISNLSTVEGPANSAGTSTVFYGSACVYDTDCQLGVDIFGNGAEGVCVNLNSDNNDRVDATEAAFDSNDDGVIDANDRLEFNLTSYVFEDDTNRVLKVYRDRECAEWLACSSPLDVWDENTAQWTDVCQGVDLCDANSPIGDGSCSSQAEDIPTVLDSDRYTSRDVSWYGMDYSGFAIPEQLPVQYYDQVNLSSGGYCTLSTGVIPYWYDLTSCSEGIDCISSLGTGYVCTDVLDLSASDIEEYGININNYHLVYAASSCEQNNGAECTAGYCTTSGVSCSDSNECSGDGECIVGYCEKASTTYCSGDSQCTTSPYNDCKNGVCTDTTTGANNSIETCDQTGTRSCSGGATCVHGALAKTGICYDNSCLIGIDGNPLDVEDAEDKTCRGYPEVSSPFTTKVVEEWINPDDLVNSSSDFDLKDITNINNALDAGQSDYLEYRDAMSYTYVYGFNDATTCAPTHMPDGNYEINDDCLCSYDKVSYGEGAAIRYYPVNTPISYVLPGVCVGGNIPGASCDNDIECNPDATDPAYPGSGICQKLTQKDIMYGWDGYCIERDTSIQLFGSNSDEDLACLSWFPIDQLTGSRNAYANDTNAGQFINEDSYYCTEVGYYADLYPVGAQFDLEGNVTGMGYACASGTDDGAGASCDYGQYRGGEDGQNCYENAYCPPDYVALVGYCNQDADSAEQPTDNNDDVIVDLSPADGGLCVQSEHDALEESPESVDDSEDDCPYFCIPNNSRHIEGEDAGELCVSTTTTDPSSLNEGYPDAIHGSSDFNRPYYLLADLYNTEDEKWDGSYSDKTKFQDCVRRGVPIGQSGTFFSSLTSGPFMTTYDSNGLYAGLTQYEYDEDMRRGFYHLDFGTIQGTSVSGSYAPYLGCYELVKTTSLDQGNKVWTNRLWNPNSVEPYSTMSSDYSYNPETLPTPDGRALYDEYFDSSGFMRNFEEDSWPLPVAAYGNGYNLSTLPTTSAPDQNLYPNTQQYYYDSTNTALNSAGLLYSSAAPYEVLPLTSTEMSDITVDTVIDTLGNSQHSSPSAITELLQQLFAKVYDVLQYDWDCGQADSTGSVTNTCGVGADDGGGGMYKRINFDGYATAFNTTDGKDISEDGDVYGSGPNYGEPTPPIIASVGECFDSSCIELNQGKFSVNGFDSDDLLGSGGGYHAAIKFFAWANSNQMPIRNVVVHWGDGDRYAESPGYNWPPDDPVGDVSSTSSYYKNRRGLEDEETVVCGDYDEWGLTSSACETSYFSYEHDYFCSKGYVEDILAVDPQGICQWADEATGRLLNSPCTGGVITEGAEKCVFQPRVHVMDNWGWCTGYCTSNPDEDSDNCYEGSVDNECDAINCPSEGGSSNCPDRSYGGIDNPWINYDGVIIVDWATQ